MTAPERFVQVSGAPNFRDIGGYETGDGRTVQWRKLFRSGELSEVPSEDALRLKAEVGISTVIDLRHPDQVTLRGSGPIEVLGATRHSLSVFPPSESFAEFRKKRAHFPPGTSGEVFAHFLEIGAGAIADVFHLLADEETYPSVIHCSGGADRTGVVIALLLEVLGVPRRTAVEDFELTNETIAEFIPNMRANGIIPETASVQEVIELRGAAPEKLERFFELLDERHGGAAQYLLAAGVRQSEIDRIQSLMLRG
jgi:protein-tyrosine phosphatase